jgi:geranylgeranyl pyrophosphate synthase
LVNFTTQAGKLVQTLAKAAGSRGMVGGQVMDIDLLDSDLTNIDLTTVHRFKTAKLIQASVRLGALMSDQLNERDYEALSEYGESIGLAFQFTDDYLDEEHQEENLQEKAASLRDQAIRAVQRVNRDTANLEKIARFVVDRSF